MYKDRKLADKPEIEANKPTEKKLNIIVNDDEIIAPKRELTFEDVVALAYDENDPSLNTETVRFSVTYHIPNEQENIMELLEGQTVKIKEGMVFDVYPTDQS